MPAHYALPIVVVKGRESALDTRTERTSRSAIHPLEPLDLNSSLRQGLPAVDPISTNSIGSGGRRRSRKSSRDLGTWGKPRGSPRHNLSCANRPSPNRTIVVKSKPSATVVYEPPSPTEQVATRVVPGVKKEVTLTLALALTLALPLTLALTLSLTLAPDPDPDLDPALTLPP
jgi:hypothetical protein